MDHIKNKDLIKKEFKLMIENNGIDIDFLNNFFIKNVTEKLLPELIRNKNFRDSLSYLINTINYKLNDETIEVKSCKSIIIIDIDYDFNYKCFSETVINYSNKYDNENELSEFSLLAYKNDTNNPTINVKTTISLLKLEFITNDIDNRFKLIDTEDSICKKLDIFCKRYKFQ